MSEYVPASVILYFFPVNILRFLDIIQEVSCTGDKIII